MRQTMTAMIVKQLSGAIELFEPTSACSLQIEPKTGRKLASLSRKQGERESVRGSSGAGSSALLSL
jgi:hypothetical protein